MAAFETLLIPFLMASIVIVGALDAVVGKIRAVTLGEYSGVVTATVNFLVYFLIYGSFFALRYQTGRIDASEVRFVWTWQPRHRFPLWIYFVLAGLCDVLGLSMQFMAQPYLPVMVFQLMLQAQVPFTVLWSAILLRQRYICTELCGVLIVVLGSFSAMVAVASTAGHVDATYALNMVLVVMGAGVNALAFVLKERVFKLAEASGITVDIFVVTSGCAVFSLLLSTPVSLLTEMVIHPEVSPIDQLAGGLACLFGGCPWAWESYSVYIGLNLLLSLSLCGLVAVHSALLSFVCMKLTTPGSAILMGCISWPIIGSSTPNASEWVALGVILTGVAVFRYGNMLREQQPQHVEETVPLLHSELSESSPVTPTLSVPLTTRQASSLATRCKMSCCTKEPMAQ